MNLLNPVSEIMTSDLITLGPSASIADVASIFKQHKIHHIPIVVEDKLVGIVSKSDFLSFKRGFLGDRDDEKVEEIRQQNYEVSTIMTTGIATMEQDERINVALEIFKENLFHAIPIVNDDKLVGVLTTHDIIKTLAYDNEAYAEYE